MRSAASRRTDLASALLVTVVCASGALGCEPTAPPPDAGLDDVGIDARLDAAVRTDSGPECELVCGPATSCCVVGGLEACVVTGVSIANCGACGNDCALTGRGDACALGGCTCGDIAIGCLGGSFSTCCVAGPTGRCADTTRDFDDCGGCERRCDVASADRCRKGECACGDEGRTCDALGEACCPALFGGGAATCARLTTDRMNCGRCGRVCLSGDVCRDGICSTSRDAGTLDAGRLDAGPLDAGPLDASLDAAIDLDAAELDAPDDDTGAADAPLTD